MHQPYKASLIWIYSICLPDTLRLQLNAKLQDSQRGSLAVQRHSTSSPEPGEARQPTLLSEYDSSLSMSHMNSVSNGIAPDRVTLNIRPPQRCKMPYVESFRPYFW